MNICSFYGKKCFLYSIIATVITLSLSVLAGTTKSLIHGTNLYYVAKDLGGLTRVELYELGLKEKSLSNAELNHQDGFELNDFNRHKCSSKTFPLVLVSVPKGKKDGFEFKPRNYLAFDTSSKKIMKIDKEGDVTCIYETVVD